MRCIVEEIFMRSIVEKNYNIIANIKLFFIIVFFCLPILNINFYI